MISKAGGMILAIIGGLISLVVLGFLLLVIYPEILILGEVFANTFKLICIIGGIVTLVGVLISAIKPEVGWIVILIGAILGGGNILSIVGAIMIKKDIQYK